MPGRSAARVEQAVRGPEAYTLAARALDGMREAGVWPTPLNFELWLHATADQDGPLSAEIQAMRARGEAITESRSEELAARFLPRAKLDEHVRDAGQHLDAELAQVARTMAAAQRSQADYGRTLAGASQALNAPGEVLEVQKVVERLAGATRRVQDENKALETRLSSSTDEIHRLREHLETARRDAMTDALSGLPNRKAFDQGLSRACAEADVTGRPMSLAVIDIDHFKRFNDTWGHQTGDQVLRFVAGIIKRAGFAPRLPSRFGGEEFALVLPGETAVVASTMLEQVREEIGSRSLKRRSTDEDLGAVTVSIGLAERRAGESATSLLERADEALYASKRGGRNRLTRAEDVAASMRAA